LGGRKEKFGFLNMEKSEGVVDMTEIIITTDGSVSGNGKPDAVGGWACILQAYRESLDTECSKCGYKGKLDEFEDTEYDGDVWGTCPKCHINCMIFIEEKKLIAEKEYSGKLVYETDSCPITNNRAEMYAILKGLESVTWKNCRIEVHSDSELCIKTLNGEYSRKTNQDLWERLDNRCMELKNRGCSIMFMWVRGHSAHVLNNRADKLAGKAKRS